MRFFSIVIFAIASVIPRIAALCSTPEEQIRYTLAAETFILDLKNYTALSSVVSYWVYFPRVTYIREMEVPDEQEFVLCEAVF